MNVAWVRFRPSTFMWVEFVIVSRLAPRGFLLILRFFFLHENQRSKFQIDQDRGPAWKQAKADVDLFLTYYLFMLWGQRKCCMKFNCFEFTGHEAGTRLPQL